MHDGVTAEVIPVSAARRGKVLTPSTKLIENGLFLTQFLISLTITFVPAIAGGIAATHNLFPGDDHLSFAPVLVGLAATAGIGWFLGGLMFRLPWSANYMFRKAQTELNQRPDAIVDVHMPEAIFVEVIPRRNWGQIALQNAEDIGFLHIDAARRELLFEGDNKRYRIPAQAVVSYQAELMNPGAANDPEEPPISLVVLRVRDHLGERELPLRAVRTVDGHSLGRNYVERAKELRRRIAVVSPGAGLDAVLA